MHFFTTGIRVISRVVLIPFGDGADGSDRLSPSARDLVDRNLQQQMNKAYRAAGIMIALGKSLCCSDSSAQLHAIMDRIATMVEGGLQRIYVSYSWLMLATLKVGSAHMNGLCK